MLRCWCHFIGRWGSNVCLVPNIDTENTSHQNDPCNNWQWHNETKMVSSCSCATADFIPAPFICREKKNALVWIVSSQGGENSFKVSSFDMSTNSPDWLTFRFMMLRISESIPDLLWKATHSYVPMSAVVMFISIIERSPFCVLVRFTRPV